MKKILTILVGALICTSVFTSCTKQEKKKTLMVGMVTDAGTIDDKSFNQGTWEGLKLAEKDLGVTVKYLKPVGTTEADYIKEITNLYDAGYKMIVSRDSSLKLPYLKLSQNMRMLNSLLSTEMHILQTRGMLRTVRTQSESASLKTNPHSLQVLRLLSR